MFPASPEARSFLELVKSFIHSVKISSDAIPEGLKQSLKVNYYAALAGSENLGQEFFLLRTPLT